MHSDSSPALGLLREPGQGEIREGGSLPLSADSESFAPLDPKLKGRQNLKWLHGVQLLSIADEIHFGWYSPQDKALRTTLSNIAYISISFKFTDHIIARNWTEEKNRTKLSHFETCLQTLHSAINYHCYARGHLPPEHHQISSFTFSFPSPSLQLGTGSEFCSRTEIIREN